MNKKRNIQDATNVLSEILRTQPALIAPMSASKEDGEGLADFIQAFIRRYSEHIEAL